MANFGSMAPGGFTPMPMMKMGGGGMGAMGANILRAALSQQQRPGAMPPGQMPALLPGSPPDSIGPVGPVSGGPAPMGLLGRLMSRMGGLGQPGIDPNSGLPITADVAGGAMSLPNMGGPGPAPTALTGLW